MSTHTRDRTSLSRTFHLTETPTKIICIILLTFSKNCPTNNDKSTLKTLNIKSNLFNGEAVTLGATISELCTKVSFSNDKHAAVPKTWREHFI